MSLTSSPKLVKGGLVVLDVATGAIRRTIALQYNPDTLTRSYQVEHLKTRDVRRTLTATSGAQTVTLIEPDGRTTTTYADGEKVVSAYGPDPRK